MAKKQAPDTLFRHRLWLHMQSIFYLLMITLVILSYSQNNEQNQSSAAIDSKQDSVYRSILIDHLRKNFDDIHDVSMRFHHIDHRLNGRIILYMYWHQGQLDSARVVENQTGNSSFALAFIDKIREWNIPGLKDHFETNLPLMIRIVGLADSTFEQKSIFTGKVTDQNGKPVRNARLDFISVANPADSLRACYTNREGIFVKTLIPAGYWRVTCRHDEFRINNIGDMQFKAGQHHRTELSLNKD